MPLWPQFNPKTFKRVEGILRTGKVNYWTGPEGKRFEAAFADYIGSKNAVSVSSGSAALELALAALGLGKGDEVICTPYTFRSSALCAERVGAKVVFADVEEADHLISAKTIERVITRRTKAIIVVHLYGAVAEMGPILALAKHRGLLVIEDCAQCLGGEYRGKKAGTLGDVGCFSFCQSKHFTTGGEGGMIVCRRASVANKVRSLRDYGWVVGTNPKVYDGIGTNARLTEIQSVIGLGELERFGGWNMPNRRRLCAALIKGLAKHPLVKILPVDTPTRRASFWLVPFVLDKRKLRVSVARFIEKLQAEGAGAYKIVWPLLAEKPVARRLIDSTVGFWVHPTRTLSDVRRDLEVFNRVAADLMR